MPLLPMGSPTEQYSDSATQESMFEEPAGLPALQAYEPVEDLSYEASEEFFDRGSGPSSVDTFGDEALLSEVELNRKLESTEDVGVSPETASEAVSETPVPAGLEAGAEPLAVLTVDDFAALEERVLRAVTLVRSERQARAAAEERAASLEVQLQRQLEVESPAIERLQQEVDSLRNEREQVRQRVERLLSQLDALEL